MRASSVTRRLLAAAVVRDWEWWRLPWPLRLYVGAVPLAALMMASHFGLNSAGAYLLSGAACTLLALWLGRPAEVPPA